ncbi:MAG: hypothetical protein K9L17_04800 [Clostridiales bacterium]|nr:hypothetical protein [Clostridiales bacterium]MCF8021993.1 hypothetical protein [Clostridiales bacterium]
MYFDTWWQGIIFGIVNLSAMLAIASLFHGMWEKYEDKLIKPSASNCKNNHH